MTNYFHEPNSFRKINCKKVGGERARKDCRAWNQIVSLRAKAKAANNLELAERIEQIYYSNDSLKTALKGIRDL